MCQSEGKFIVHRLSIKFVCEAENNLEIMLDEFEAFPKKMEKLLAFAGSGSVAALL